MLQISELKKDLEMTKQSNFSALVIKVESGTVKDGKPYLNVYLQDASGIIMGKKWSVTEQQMKEIVPGLVVNITGKVKEYKDRLQLIIDEIEVNKSINKELFIPCAPLDIKTLKEAINQYLMQIKNPVLYRITLTLLQKYNKSYYEFPAASKNHHEFKSGLAYHVKTMLDLARVICDIYPDLDRDLLYAGVILHDLGKVIELSGYESTTYTAEGKLLGHIAITSNEIAITAKDLGFESEEVMLLEHMVLSHHGKLEYGSPKVPMLREAEVLNLIDNVDARIIMMNSALSDTEYGDFTSRIFALENRQFYKPNYYLK